MRDVGLVNILCDSELILAQVVDRERHLYRSLNVTMGTVSALDIVEAVEVDGILKFVSVVEEGVPHKKLYYFDTNEKWRDICIAGAKYPGRCIIQGLTHPKGTQPGIFAVAYEEDFDPDEVFGDLVQAIPEE